MFDLKGFRKDRKMSQKQISEILGIGTSFISQIETGKDPMPGYIPDKLAEAYGKEEVDKYYRQSPFENIDIDRHGRGKSFHFPSFFSVGRSTDEGESDGRVNGNLPVENDQMMDRVLLALERRDELAFMQQKEYERQGARLDEILTFIKARD